MKNIKILFQGDSITDAGRDRRNYHDLGPGYPNFAAQLIATQHPETDFEFINLGISGNRTCQLFDRLTPDAIDFAPDIISILIGINDVWHRHDSNRVYTTDEQLALNYRCILDSLKKRTNAKIIMLAPYVLDAEQTQNLKEDLVTVIPIIEGLAHEYADCYIPLNEYFDEAIKTQPAPLYYSADGVHPNEQGAKFIAQHYARAVDKLLKKNFL